VDAGILFGLTIIFTGLLLLIQRSERKRRLLVALVMLVPVELIRRFTIIRGVEGEMWTALGIALVLNFFFWLLIGRYNPVRKSEDEIQVFRMDD
jgi:hypothetical protein